MATTAAIQAQLDPASTGNVANITQEFKYDGTSTAFYVVGGIGYDGVAKWILTTTAQTAAQQATAITTSLALH